MLDYIGMVASERSLQRFQDSMPSWSRRETDGEKRPVNVGFVGAGNYAHHHIKILQSLNNVTVHSILITGSERSRSFAVHYQVPHVFSDQDAFLAQAGVDCFVIVVSAWNILPLAMACLATGKPVLLEKPAGVSPAETLQLCEQADAHGTYGMVCM
ncbi:MAG: Gfo/Idh/MocA family oxidoreductase, partial [Caldilineales bacterium]|nr:Gfo/Idh/MocA family oxidoreductase [Caldilineales bacterium]